MSTPETPRRLRAQLAAARRHHPEADHTALVLALREATTAALLRRLLALAPPLDARARQRLAVILLDEPAGGSR